MVDSRIENLVRTDLDFSRGKTSEDTVGESNLYYVQVNYYHHRAVN